jgi:hypothetical protein
MHGRSLDRWLRLLRTTATFVHIAALCLAVALLVIAMLPGSPVRLALPTGVLTGVDRISGTTGGVVVDHGGRIAVKIDDASLGQRLLYAATTIPCLLLIAEVARRLAALLRASVDHDPFIPRTAHDLTKVAKITAIGGLATWVTASGAAAALSATMLDSGAALEPHGSPLGWLAVALIFAALARLIERGVGMRAELDTVI